MSKPVTGCINRTLSIERLGDERMIFANHGPPKLRFPCIYKFLKCYCMFTTNFAPSLRLCLCPWWALHRCPATLRLQREHISIHRTDPPKTAPSWLGFCQKLRHDFVFLYVAKNEGTTFTCWFVKKIEHNFSSKLGSRVVGRINVNL